ncbi:MAG: sigma-70 family RNA polymerase sigma factor [Opitutaceae bacterium]
MNRLPNIADADRTEKLLRQFYSQQSKLRGYVFSATRNYHATEEILQSTAIVVAQKAGKFDFNKEPAPWFIGIAKNHIQKWYRSQGQSKSRNVSLDLLEECLPEYESFESNEVSARREALTVCIRKLPAKQKEVVQLRYMEDMRCPSIAKELNRPIQGIYSLLKRLKLELRKCVELRLKEESVLS